MPTPEQLEQDADDLRGYATQARTKAQSLATHLDPVVTTSKDDAVWKGPYPTAATTDLTGLAGDLGTSADILRHDAAAWDKRAGELDDQAAGLRAEAKKKAQDAKDSPGETPAGTGGGQQPR